MPISSSYLAEHVPFDGDTYSTTTTAGASTVISEISNATDRTWLNALNPGTFQYEFRPAYSEIPYWLRNTRTLESGTEEAVRPIISPSDSDTLILETRIAALEKKLDQLLGYLQDKCLNVGQGDLARALFELLGEPG